MNSQDHVVINFDMDGVLSDFDGAIAELCSVAMVGNIPSDFWDVVCKRDRVFAQMKPIPEGVKLLRDVEALGFGIRIATSTGGGKNHLNIAMQKLEFLERHGLDKYPVAFCTNTKNKASVATPGAVLIDDREKVLKEWCAAGGDGLMFTRASGNVILHYLKTKYGRG